MNKDKAQLIVSTASAGSGKTFALVKEYLKLAFDGPESGLETRFTHILAITFTNKAANEMKERILNSLDEIVDSGAEYKMTKLIVEETGLDVATVQRYARIVKTSILHNYSDFAVYTIDSFMQRIVRTFAYDLDLPMRYDVSMDNDEIMDRAIDELLSKVGEDDETKLSEFLKTCIKDNMEEGSSYNSMKRELKQSAEKMFEEESIRKMEQLGKMKLDDFLNIMKDYQLQNREFRMGVRNAAKRALDVMNKSGVEVADLYYGVRGIGGYFVKVAAGEELDLGGTSTQDFVTDESKLVSKAGEEKADVVAGIKPKLCECYGEIKAFLGNGGLEAYNTRNLILSYLPTMALLNMLQAIVNEDSKENEVLHISEFNKAIARVVETEPVPFIYERVGCKYWNFLIDEFQDTSKQQWLNLVPLLDNGVSSNHTSLIVGDGKQAIYRFRNGDVNQFLNLPKVEDSQHGKIFMKTKFDLPLSINYRSCKNIVEFNNRLYLWMAGLYKKQNKAIYDIYSGGKQEWNHEEGKVDDKVEGYVEVNFYQLEKEKKTDNSFEAEMHKAILAEVERQYSLGYSYSDMMVLGRSNKTLSGVGRALSKEGIPVVSNESFLLSNSKAVMLIKSMLHFLLDNSNRAAAMQVLVLLDELNILPQGAAYEYDMIRSSNIIDLEGILHKYGIEVDFDALHSMSLYDCCETLIKNFRLEQIEQMFVSTLLNKVLAYENRNHEDLVGLLDYLDKGIDKDFSFTAQHKKKISSQTSSDKDAVKLMTVHSSKGLEAKVVFYAINNPKDRAELMWVKVDRGKLPVAMVSLKRDSNSDFDRQWLDEQLKCQIDDINTMYVATTRPREKLFIYCDKKTSPKNVNLFVPVNHLYRFVTEIDHVASWEMEEKDCWVESYSIGENGRKGVEKESSSPFEMKELEHLSYPDWHSRIRIASQADKIFESQKGEQIRRGLMMHEVLSKIKKCDDVEAAVERYARMNEMMENEKEELNKYLNKAVKNDKIRRFFEGNIKVLNEHELVYQGKVLRPDRIVMNGEEVIVIDFKTGSPNVLYYDQVRRYCAAVEDMGYKSVRGYLVFIGNEEIEVEEV